MTPARFWRRYAAWSLDAVLVGAPALLLALPIWPWRAAWARLVADHDALLHEAGRTMGEALLESGAAGVLDLPRQWLADPAMRTLLHAPAADVLALCWPPLFAFVLAGALYHAFFESGPRGATPGQRALGLRVVNARGSRIGPARALLRHAAGALSWLTLNLGHALALAPPERRALHDIVSDTRVVQGADRRLPAWARGWLALQALLMLLLMAAWHAASQRALQAGLDAALGV